MSSDALGEKLFKLRDYTPIPLIVLLFAFAQPNVFSATIGTLVLIFGELYRIYSVAFIGSISRTRKSQVGSKLISEGPFSMVRNPLYVGNFIIVMGVAIYSAVLWLVVLTAVSFCWQYYWIVRYEESLLNQKFGEEYSRYKEQVPAWIPKALPRISELSWPDSFSYALISEKRTLTAIGAMLSILTYISLS